SASRFRIAAAFVAGVAVAHSAWADPRSPRSRECRCDDLRELEQSSRPIGASLRRLPGALPATDAGRPARRLPRVLGLSRPQDALPRASTRRAARYTEPGSPRPGHTLHRP